jgi:DNA-binding phage protein
MADFTDFSEASLLYADNYYLVERLEQIFKKEQAEFFQAFRHRIQKKDWMASGKWKINISGTYFELRYQTEEGREPFLIYLILGARNLANKNIKEGKEGDKRSFEIALAARPDASNLKELRKKFFEEADDILKNESEIEYYPTRATGQALVRKQAEYSLPNLINAMETEVERFVKIAEYARRSLVNEG